MIVVFDAKCLLCSGWVHFLLEHDTKKQFRFASIQGAGGQKLLHDHGIDTADPESLLLIDGERSWQQSAAIMEILSRLGFPWTLAKAGHVLPASLRDVSYRFIARNRYRMFGRTEACLVPPADAAYRFID